MDLSGKKELVEFILTFMSSTWYIKNPYLKAKLVQVRLNFILCSWNKPTTTAHQIMFYGILPYGRDQMGVLGPILNSHPTALNHLIPVLMSFYVGRTRFLHVSTSFGPNFVYVEVEQTGAHSQFYDKFDAR